MNPVDILRLLSLAAIWGASFLFMRIIAPVIGTIPTAFFRVSIAAAGLLVILGLMRISWDFKGKLKTVMLLGVINSGIPATLYSVAAQVLPAGYSAIFNATTPLMGVLIGGLFFHEKLTAAKLGGVFLGLFGVGILTRAGSGGVRHGTADGRPRLPARHHLLWLCRVPRPPLARSGRWPRQSSFGAGQHARRDVVLAAAVWLQRDQPATGELGRLECLVVVAGVGSGMHGVCVHYLLPLAELGWPGEIDDHDLPDPAVRRVVGGAVAG